ncbi:hypothetical protein AN394_04181 [Pseudoalteromonas sp. P1-26]|uniref:hypothetical protein n=1 Tax=Pseudoalteromonas sp. P1-26 TaxID=1723759 RepID=UPI0006D67EB1|nr:hypothetical protein [Pseudoalteromonas sp. P1-26]KPZ66255.1 hypothetical protein AN394_04181 [Pseudoalteromonas sp. P1-26]
MNFLKEQWVRVFYTFISIVFVWISLKFKNKIIDNVESFNEFSYIGVVATLVALMVAIFEVMHSINLSKGIREEAKKLLKQSQEINGASFVSECLSVLDEANDHISSERYNLSLKCFQHFRRTYLRISGDEELIVEINNRVGAVELGLQQATHTTAKAPLTKKKRLEIQESILNIKKNLEDLNPVKRGSHVST